MIKRKQKEQRLEIQELLYKQGCDQVLRKDYAIKHLEKRKNLKNPLHIFISGKILNIQCNLSENAFVYQLLI